MNCKYIQITDERLNRIIIYDRSMYMIIVCHFTDLNWNYFEWTKHQIGHPVIIARYLEGFRNS